MFPALAIPKAYIVLICTVVPKDFQRSFIGSKLLLIVCSIMGGIWGMGRTFVVVDFLEAPPGHSGHLFGGENPFLLNVWAPYIRCQHCKAPGSVRSCSIMCNSCWKRDHAMGAWFQLEWTRAGFLPQKTSRSSPRKWGLRSKVKFLCDEESFMTLQGPFSSDPLWICVVQTFIVKAISVAQVSLKPCGFVSGELYSHWRRPRWLNWFQHCLWIKGSQEN